MQTRAPHPVAEVLWLAWFGNAVVATLTGWPGTVGPEELSAQAHLTNVVLASFFLLEIGGWLRSRNRPWGGTLSEVVWWRIPWWPARWLLGTALGVATWAMVSPLAGFVLIVWLGAHFAFRTNQERPHVGTTTPLRDIQGDLDEVRRQARENEDAGGVE